MKINLKLVKSSLDTVRDDYTAIVVTNGTAFQSDLIADVHKSEPHISENSAAQVLATEFAFIGAMIAEGNFVNLGGIGLSPFVEGSLLHADQEVTSDMLGIQVNVYDSDYLDAIKSLEVTTSVDEDSLQFNFTKVEDSATKDFGTVTPGYEFMPIGDKLSQGLDGERIEITDKDGTVKVITDATGSSSGMWLKAMCPRGLKAGKGKLTVYSRGLKTPEGAVDHISRSITIRAATVEPKILSILSEGTGLDSELTTLKDKVTVSVEGCSLRNAKAQFILRDHDGRYMASTDFDDRYHYADFEILSDTQATYHCRENGSEEPDGSWAAYDAALQIKLEDGTLLEKPVNIRS